MEEKMFNEVELSDQDILGMMEGAEEDEEEAPIGEKSQEQEKVTRLSPFEKRYEASATLFRHNASVRWAMYHVLEACNTGTPQRLNWLEEMIMKEPGFATLNRPPYFLVEWLENAFSLEIRYLDAEGTFYTDEDVRGLSEDELDDLVSEYAYLTTEVGQKILVDFAPAEGIKVLLQESPACKSIYLDALKFACQKCDFAAINRYIRGSEAFATILADNPDATPGMFIEKLSKVGGLTYDEGWQTTAEGKELLRQVEEEQ